MNDETDERYGNATIANRRRASGLETYNAPSVSTSVPLSRESESDLLECRFHSFVMLI